MLDTIGSVLVIGAGKMGMALTRGWVVAGLDGARITLVDPQPHDSVVAWAQEQGADLRDSIPAQGFDVVLLAVKPQVFPDAANDIKQAIDENSLVLSIMAGFSLERMGTMLGTKRIVRTMPNTPSQVGKGVTGLVRGSGVSDTNWAQANALFSASGLVVELPNESQIDALTVVSGSGPAYVFWLVECMAAAGVELGLDADDAMVLARQTVIGAAGLMEADATDAEQLRKNVTSPNGTTQAALEVLMAEDGMKPLFMRALTAARDRNRELGQ